MRLRDGYREGKRRQVLSAGTGSGKTLTSLYLIESARQRGEGSILFLVDRVALVNQTSRVFDEYGIDHGVIQADHWRWQPWNRIQIASMQTLKKRQWPERLSLVVYDECFPGDVEVLTDAGWTRFDALADDQKVAQWDSGDISFVQPSRRVQRPFVGHLIELRSDSAQIRMTPGHELVLRGTPGVLKKVRVDQAVLNNYYRIPTAGIASGEDRTLTAIERLLIATQADGSIHNEAGSGTVVAFGLTKQRKIDRLLWLAAEAGVAVSEVKCSRPRARRFMVKFPAGALVSKDLWDHFQPNEWHGAKAERVVQEMGFWDGYVRGDVIYYSSTDKRQADFFQTAAVLANRRANMGVQRDERAGANGQHKPVWRVPSGVRAGGLDASRFSRRDVYFEGDVYCVTVPSGAIIVRAGGMPMVVGNCHARHEAILRHLKHADCPVLGLTATPWGDHLGKYFQGIVQMGTTDGLIADGWLKRYRFFAPSAPDMEGVEIKSTGEWEEEGASQRAVAIVGDVVASYAQRASGRKFIAFGVETKHCAEMARQFTAAGIETACYTYQTPEREREILERRLKDPNDPLMGLVTVSALSRGFDAPLISCIIHARPLRKSIAEFIQGVGRGFRQYPGAAECIARGSLVLTDKGEVPIEDVTLDHKVWDGLEFVRHAGATCKGVRPVLTYDGLTATPDHEVMTDDGWTALGDAARDGRRVARTGVGGRPVRLADDRVAASEELPVSAGGGGGVRALQATALHEVPQHEKAARHPSVPALQRPPAGNGAEVAVPAMPGPARSLSESEEPGVAAVRWPRRGVSVLVGERGGAVGGGGARRAREPEALAARPDGQPRPLRAGEPEVGLRKPESEKLETVQGRARPLRGVSSTAPGGRIRASNNLEASAGHGAGGGGGEVAEVWDLLSAGPRHRFTANGLLVHNCIVLDHGGSLSRLGPDVFKFFREGASALPSGKAKTDREKKARDPADPVQCPGCSHWHLPHPTCPSCGFEYPRSSRVRVVNGELVEVGSSGWAGAAELPAGDQLLRQLEWIRRATGFKPGWLFYTYRDITGSPPVTTDNVTPERPSDQLAAYVQVRLNEHRRLAAREARQRERQQPEGQQPLPAIP